MGQDLSGGGRVRLLRSPHGVQLFFTQLLGRDGVLGQKGNDWGRYVWRLWLLCLLLLLLLLLLLKLK